MSRLKKVPLRPLTDDEVAELTKLSRSRGDSATRVARAGMILAVARGCDAEGLAALDPRHGGGRAPADVAAALDGVPPDKAHGPALAIAALRDAPAGDAPRGAG